MVTSPMFTKGVTHACAYWVVFCSKYRRKVLTADVAARLHDILEDSAREVGSAVLQVDITEDTVQLLCTVPPQFGVHKLVKRLKGRSSRLLRAEFPALKRRLPTLWTNAYFVATVGERPDAAIADYIESQKNT